MRCAALMVLLGVVLQGCGVLGLSGRSRDEPREERVGPGNATVTEVQSEIMSFADTFNGLMSQQWNQAVSAVEAAAAGSGEWKPTPEQVARARRSALEIKLANASAVNAIASSPNPIVGVADLLTVVTLQRMVLEETAPRTFGEASARALVGALREQEARLWRIAERVYTVEQRQELADLLAQWRQVNPGQRYVSAVRLEDFAKDRQLTMTTVGSGNSVLSLLGIDPLAGLDPTTREVQKSRLLGERMFFYASRSPNIMKWHVESLASNLARMPELQGTVASLDRVSKAAEVIAAQSEALPKNLEAEREATLKQAFDSIREERQATIDQIFEGLTQQRTALLDDLDTRQGELQKTTEQVRLTLETAQGTIESAKELTASVSAIITEARSLTDKAAALEASGPPKLVPEPDRDVLKDYAVAVDKTGVTIDRLSALTTRFESLLASPQLEKQAEVVNTSLAHAESSSKDVIDYAFWRLLVLVIVGPLATAGAVVLVRRVGGRG